MKLIKSNRQKTKIKMALQGPAGSGKTYSSILIASGLISKDLSKVAVIDSENGSSNLYAEMGDYNVLVLDNYSPENYIKAIEVCEREGMEVIIIDSITHAWEFLLEYHSSLSGNSFTNWSKITPRQKAFMQKILNCKCHVICTMRTKQDYVINQKEGKFIPEKVGLKAVQRDGVEYEFTIILDLNIKHFANSSKDRTGLFMDKSEFKITKGIGTQIKKWCNDGSDLEKVRELIKNCISNNHLNEIYRENIEFKENLNADFIERQKQLNNNINNFSQNGTTSN